MDIRGIYEQVKQHDPKAANWYRTFADGLHQADSDTAPAPHSLRGAALHTMQEVVGSCDGALGGEGTSRHLFLSLCMGGGSGSTKSLTGNHAAYILQHFSEPVEGQQGQYRIQSENAEKARQLLIAAVSAGIELPLPDPQPKPQEAITMSETKHVPTTYDFDHAEAPLSATAKFADKTGASWLFTMRAGVTGEMLVKFVQDLSKASEYMAKSGFAPETGYHGNGNGS